MVVVEGGPCGLHLLPVETALGHTKSADPVENLSKGQVGEQRHQDCQEPMSQRAAGPGERYSESKPGPRLPR